MLRTHSLTLAGAFAAAALVTGCGGTSGAPSTASSSTSAATGAGSGALSADAHSAATGDIPDNQVFLVFRDANAGYSVKYPEGWTQSGSGRNVTFRSKNNLVHVAVARRNAPTLAAVSAELTALGRADGTLRFRPPTTITLGAARAVKATYSTQSAPNPVTGKRVTLLVDRYVLSSGGRVATVDLGTPRGVDNVDAYRMMIASFRWH